MADEILRDREVGWCPVCERTKHLALITELQDQIVWLEGLLESSRQVNRMWEATARYAIKRLGGDDDTQAIEAYSAAEGYIPEYPK